MKHSLLVLAGLVSGSAAACLPDSIDPRPYVEYAELPLHWEMITNRSEQFIRFHSCDAENPQVTIDKENHKIVVLYGQEAVEFNLLSWRFSEDEFADEVEYRFYFTVKSAGGTEKEFVLNYDKSGGVSSWSGVFDAPGPTLFIPDKFAEKYPVVKQPCRECWGDECDER